MIRFVNGDMFSTTYDAYVNPVNCKGIMGKGLALDFKKRYPMNFILYKDICDQGKLKPGYVYWTRDITTNTTIINFATKDHWKDYSRSEWIDSGCMKLRQYLIDNPHNIKDIAIPKLGCGLGGLDWSYVRNIFLKYFNDITNVDIYVYE